MKTLTENQLLALAAKSIVMLNKSEAEDLLRKHGHTISRNVEGLRKASERICKLRYEKRMLASARKHRGSLRLGSCDLVPKSSPFATPSRGLAYRLGLGFDRPEGATPAERRDSYRNIVAVLCFQRIYDTGRHGSVRARYTTAGEAGCGVTQEVGYGRYSGRCRFKKQEVHTTITVPQDWLSRVYLRELTHVDGLMTLWAQPVDAVGCEAFAATWVEQGRGSKVKVVQGYIARSNGVSFHASTLSKAIAGLKRKAHDRNISLLSNEQLLELAKHHAGTKVSVSDARAIGACEPGIRSWVARTSIALRDEATTLGELVAAYTLVPATEARAVIVRALRRCRALAA